MNGAPLKTPRNNPKPPPARRPLVGLPLFVILGLAEFARGALFIILLPFYVTQRLGLSLSLASLAISLHYLADTLFKSPSGWLVDRMGAKRLLLAGMALSLFSLGLIQREGHIPALLLLGTFLFGLGTSPNWPAVVNGATGQVEETQRATVMGFVFIAWLVGAGAGPVVINFLLTRTYAMAFLAVWVAYLIAAGLSVTLRGEAVERGHPSEHHHLPLREQIAQIQANLSSVKILFPGMFVQTMALGLLLPIISLYAGSVLHLTHREFGFLLIAGGAITVLFLVPMGRVADRFGSRYLLTLGFGVSGVSLFALTRVHAFLWVVVWVGLLGASYSVILPSWNALLARAMPPERRGVMWGVFMSVDGLGIATGPAVGGQVWSTFGHDAPFLLSALILLVMAFFYLIYPVDRIVPGPKG